jgi:hypothetical protein
MGESATLRALIDAEAPMRPARAVELALQILATLEELHASGRVHGDVCAERVMLRNGHAALLPPARETRSSERGRDIHGAGAILYELLTRAKPHEGTPVSLRTPAVLPARLDEVVARAIDVSHAERFESARPFAQELRVCLLDALGTVRKQHL